MCAKLSGSKNRKLDKPFRRTRIGQSPIIICFSLVVVGYAFFYKRQVGEICLGPTIGCGIFFIERLLLFLLELIHRNSFDCSNTLKLIAQPSSTSQEDQSGYGFFIRLMFVTVGITQLPPLENWFEFKVDIFILLLTIIVGIHFQWYDCALLECHRLEKPLSYSGGSAMAFSFYYGYLKLIAPGLVSRIIQFRDNEKIEDEQIPEKKLFVLVPSSSFVSNTVKGYQHCSKTRDLTIENVGQKFPEHLRDRGLIRGRSYKTAIYIAEYNEKKYYVLLMDTPLKTFYETCREQKEFEAMKKEVVHSFYYTLEKLIEDNLEMRDIVKLIYYDDENEDLKVPDIVKDRILMKIKKI